MGVLRPVLGLGVVILAGLLQPVAGGQGHTVAEVTVEARESDCPDGHRWCLVVTEGDLAELVQGQTVEVTFVNAGQSGHQLSISYWHDRDPSHEDTPASAAFFSTDRVPAGRSIQGTTAIPEDAHNIYLWCDVPGHETGGMWIESPVTLDTQDPADQGPVPLPGLGALVGAVAAGALLVAVRRG